MIANPMSHQQPISTSIVDSRMRRNIFYSGVVQFCNYGYSAITVPLLAHLLGVSGYGILALAAAVNTYLWLVIDWGFSIGANRDVARARRDPEALSAVFSETAHAKMLIAAAVGVVFLSLGFLKLIPEFHYLALSGLFTIIGASLSSDWFFQGIEDMRVTATITFSVRVVILALLILLVHGEKDLLFVCTILGMASSISGAAGFLLAARRVRRKPFPSTRRTIVKIIEYRHYFFSQSAWIMYASAAPIVLTFVSNHAVVGMFAGAERISRFAVMLIMPVATALYPRVNALMAISKEEASTVSGLAWLTFLVYGLAVAILLIVFAPLAVHVIFGDSFSGAVPTLRIIAFFPLLVCLNGAFSNQFLIPLGHRKIVSRVSVSAGALYLVLLFILGRRFGADGAAMSLIGTEIVSFAVYAISLVRLDADYLRSAIALTGARRIVGGTWRKLRPG